MNDQFMGWHTVFAWDDVGERGGKSLTGTGLVFTGTGNASLRNIEIFGDDSPPPVFTVRYDANGGANAPAPQLKAEGKTINISTTIPTRKGYKFLGWTDTKTAVTAQFQPGDPFTEDTDVTLYALWEKLIDPEPVILRGDVDEDTLTDIGDVIFLLRALVGLETLSDQAKANATGVWGREPSIDDVIWILRFIVGFEER